ncbi:MAG: class I SAM-dependent methyltransferase [Patescibacteria group bacterium]
MSALIITILYFLLFVTIIILAFFLNNLYALLKIKVPYVATPVWAINYIINNLAFKDSAVVYDLGCGDARFLVALKKKYPKIKAVGYELAWWPFLMAKRQIKRSKLDIDLKRGNFYNARLSEADIIFCFLIHSVMPKLEKKLLEELKPGAQVISYGFKFPNWKTKEIIANPDKPNGSKINIYQK